MTGGASISGNLQIDAGWRTKGVAPQICYSNRTSGLTCVGGLNCWIPNTWCHILNGRSARRSTTNRAVSCGSGMLPGRYMEISHTFTWLTREILIVSHVDAGAERRGWKAISLLASHSQVFESEVARKKLWWAIIPMDHPFQTTRKLRYVEGIWRVWPDMWLFSCNTPPPCFADWLGI